MGMMVGTVTGLRVTATNLASRSDVAGVPAKPAVADRQRAVEYRRGVGEIVAVAHSGKAIAHQIASIALAARVRAPGCWLSSRAPASASASAAACIWVFVLM